MMIPMEAIKAISSIATTGLWSKKKIRPKKDNTGLDHQRPISKIHKREYRYRGIFQIQSLE
jgi:hypothetical protein